MKNAISRLLSLYSNARGNVAMIFALAIVPILMVAGTAIDLGRISNAKMQLQISIDNAVLAAANLQYDDDPKKVVTNWVESQMGVLGYETSSFVVQTEITKNVSSKEVTGTVSMVLPMAMMSLAGNEDITITVSSTAFQSIPNLELAMVLDISSSMNGNRLKSLKSASTLFVDLMLTDDTKASTSISVVPFGGTVNIGETLFEEFAVPLPADSEDKKDKKDKKDKEDKKDKKDKDDSEPENDTILDPDEDSYEDVEENDFRFSDGDYCIEAFQDDYDMDLIPETSRSQVPHFWRWWNFHGWCPHEDSAVFLNSNDQSALEKHLNGMVLSDGTGMDIGALWGLKVLSPDYRGLVGGDFSDRPLDMDAEQSRKVMIVMTDGNITQQDRPEDYSLFNTHTNRSDNNEANGNGKGNQGNNSNKQTSLSRGNASHTSSKDTAVGRFKLACETAKANNILVFTIGFQIKSGSIADVLLDECATSSEYYYHVESLDLDAAFTSIASQVNELRITK